VLQKLLTWLAVIIVALWVIQNPAGAAALAHHVAHAVSTLAGNL
jgi:hypothetical protein